MRVFVVAASTIVLAILALAVWRPPVLLRLKDPTTIDPGDGRIVLFNPLRERESERAAVELLQLLSQGKCEQALSFVQAEERRDHCGREANYPIVARQLRDRENGPDGVRLFFVVRRGPATAAPANAWITVRQGPDRWLPVRYYAVY